jgi:hypothetical protein
VFFEVYVVRSKKVDGCTHIVRQALIHPLARKRRDERGDTQEDIGQEKEERHKHRCTKWRLPIRASKYVDINQTSTDGGVDDGQRIGHHCRAFFRVGSDDNKMEAQSAQRTIED